MTHPILRAARLAVRALPALALVPAGQALQDAAAPPLPTEDPAIERLHPMLAPVIEQGPFSPSWESLVTHPLPRWFEESKVGISAHWGPYCVPGWTPRKDTPYGVAYAEWYWQWMQSNQAVQEHHRTVYGGVPYDAFIDGTPNLATGERVGFFAEDFDADAWMDLFARAGVRVRWMDYPAYRPYTQRSGKFEPGVSILDTLAHVPTEEVFVVE